MRLRPVLAVASALVVAASAARAEMPFPTCLGPVCTDPTDYASYLFLAPGVLPNDFNGGDTWKYNPTTGMNIVGAWQLTTGRPDVAVAILDSGIKWQDGGAGGDIRKKVRLNLGELAPACAPVPGRSPYDCNGDGVVTVDDWANAGVPDVNGNGIDAEDLIKRFSNGIDEDGNGYVDDIAGWDFAQNDNDPLDEVQYGHGTGEAHDQVSEANNGGGFPGVSPSSLFVPLKVADSFVAIDSDFARAVVYATDLGVDLISEALGSVSAGPASQEAIDYAYHRGIPIIASAADEESRHHNYPANFEHTIWVNSIRDGDGTFVAKTGDYTLLNGCTNYGGRAWVAIPSTSCSSEATGRSAGLTALLISHGKNLIDRGLLSPYPGLTTPFSAEEIRQLYRKSAQDIDQSGNLALTFPASAAIFYRALSKPPLYPFASTQFPSQAGWDQFTGYGRPDATVLLNVTPSNIPPEADLSGSLSWFDVVDPTVQPSVAVVGSAAAERERVRTGRGFTYTVEVGCGVQPKTFMQIGSGSSGTKLVRATLANWNPAQTAQACGFDPAAVILDPDAHTVQLRLRVTDATGNLGEDLRTVAIHHDPTLRFSKKLGASGESSAVLADLDHDGALEIIIGTAAGEVHALRGSDGSELPGFPALTDFNPAPKTGRSAYANGTLKPPREVILAAVAADDLDGDGHVEIVAASAEGKVYVFDDHGRRRPGFPVSTNPAFSNTFGVAALSDPDASKNDTDPGIASAPVLVNLDGVHGDPKLEIVTAGLDGFLYAWRTDGTPVAGFPVQLADRSRVNIDPATGHVAAKSGSAAQDRLRKVLSSPAVADLDGDGFPELVVATNEEYGNYTASFATDSNLVTLLQSGAFSIDAFSTDIAGRMYVVQHDGNLHAGGPFRAGWPVEIPLLAPGLLPTVATGTPGSPAIADLNGDGNLTIAIFGAAGPVMLFDKDGQPALGIGTNGIGQDAPIPLAVDFPNGGFPLVPATAGSGDAPFFPALGSGAFGDLTGDTKPEYVAPTGGVRQLLDVGAPGSQEFGDHSITAWDPRTGAVLPAFPRKMDDMQFLASPGIADVDGDGAAEVIQGSGGYLVHAYRADGAEPAGWPKFTHGWMIPAPTAGDVDGDGKLDVVASSREGRLFVWGTPAPATANAVQWQGFGRDRRHTKNLSSGVPTIAAAAGDFDSLVWTLESIDLELRERTQAPGIGIPIRKTTAPVTVRLALYYFTHDDVPTGTALLRFAEIGLRMPPGTAELADLHAQFVDAVSATAHHGVSNIGCSASDAACVQDKRTAQGYVTTGDMFAAAGRDAQAVVWWARAFEAIDAH